MSALQQAVTLEPDNAQYRYVLAVALHQNGQVGPACDHMEELLKRQPAFRDARLALIQFYLDSGQEPKAQVVLQAWKKINPEDLALK